jgi:hypothetical protein
MESSQQTPSAELAPSLREQALDAASLLAFDANDMMHHRARVTLIRLETEALWSENSLSANAGSTAWEPGHNL